jgi:hypothetical protein
MAKEQIEAVEQQFRRTLADALASLKTVGARAAQQIIDEYAPRFARLATMDPADAKQEYDDLIVNLEADQNVNAIDAQTAGVRSVLTALRVVANVARTMIFSSAGTPIPPPPTADQQK